MEEKTPAFQAEKQNVLGELSYKFKKIGSSDDLDHLPPPPPVFQTYGHNLLGEEGEDLPPPPPFLLQRKQSDVCTPLPPPPPSINPPDYSKLSPRKKDEDQCTPPKLLPVTPAGPRRSSEDETGKQRNENPYLNPRSGSYADSLTQHVAEKRVLSDRKPSLATPAAADGSSGSLADQIRKVSLDGADGRRVSSAPAPVSSAERKPSAGGLSTKILVNKEQETEGNHHKKDCCHKCGDNIDIGGIIALSRAYHKACFQCTECGKVLHARFNSMNGEPFCDQCYEDNGERCSVCEGLIVGDSLKSGDKFFHPHCMKCCTCGEELSGTYFTSGNNFICEKDYKASLEKCSVCGDILTGGFYKLDDKNICEKDYKKQLAACGLCGQSVEGKLLKLSDKVFHPSCFNCTVCGVNLSGEPFSQDDEKSIYCTQDYQRKYASKCCGCGEAIIPEKGQNTAERVRVQGKDFHPRCFKCQDCGLVFDSSRSGHECYPLDNLFLCKPCNLKRINNM